MKLKKIHSKEDISDEDEEDGYLIDADEKTARSIIASLKSKGKTDKVIAVLGRDNTFNRRALETLQIDYLVSPELGERKDTLHQRDSGLNHVLAKIAKEKDIAIVIDFKDWNSIKDKKEKARRLARIIQNVKICRKAKCKIKIWGSDDKRLLKSFGFSLGMSSEQVRDCC